MAQPRGGRASRVRRRDEGTLRRARRNAGLSILGAIVLLIALLTAFGGRGTTAPTTIHVSGRLLPAGPPTPQIVASAGQLRLQLPISQSRVTAIGYHTSGDGGLALNPVGRQGNAGLVARLMHRLVGSGGNGPVWYGLGGGGSGPATGAVDVGAAVGTDVYAPVDGIVVGITDYVVNNQPYGVRIDIQPQSAPSLVVSLTHLRADPALAVGSPVRVGTSKLGTVMDLSSVEKQALARYTQDKGNHVSLEVRPAPTLTLD
jgi:hypothetical protein